MKVLTESPRKVEPRRIPPRMAFGEVTVDFESRRVWGPTGASSLEPRVFDLLLTLVERPGLTASRGHLIETVWNREDGAHAALNQAVVKLRQALGDDVDAPRFIETVPRIGYRWIFEPPPERVRPPSLRWSSGPAWVAGGAALAVMVGGLGGLGAYAWAQAEGADPVQFRKVRIQRIADVRCSRRVQVMRGLGRSSQAGGFPPAPSSPACRPPVTASETVKR